MRIHLRIHLRLKYECGICGKLLSTKQIHDYHILNSHGSEDKEIFTCSFCPQTFTTKLRAYYHERNVHGEKKDENFNCFVMKIFSVATKNFVCETCQKSFKSKTHLKRHRTGHLGLKFDCELCGKSLSSKEVLNFHIRTYHSTEDETFPCSICAKMFRSQLLVKMHEKKVHGESTKRNAILIFFIFSCLKTFQLKFFSHAKPARNSSKANILWKDTKSFMARRWNVDNAIKASMIKKHSTIIFTNITSRNKVKKTKTKKDKWQKSLKWRNLKDKNYWKFEIEIKWRKNILKTKNLC